VLVAWTAATAFGWVDTRILVSPWEVVKTAWSQLTGWVI
jgi:ABC-type nitrate/sulfonate/bicarbonate transport system permease component